MFHSFRTVDALFYLITKSSSSSHMEVVETVGNKNKDDHRSTLGKFTPFKNTIQCYKWESIILLTQNSILNNLNKCNITTYV